MTAEIRSDDIRSDDIGLAPSAPSRGAVGPRLWGDKRLLMCEAERADELEAFEAAEASEARDREAERTAYVKSLVAQRCPELTSTDLVQAFATRLSADCIVAAASPLARRWARRTRSSTALGRGNSSTGDERSTRYYAVVAPRSSGFEHADPAGPPMRGRWEASPSRASPLEPRALEAAQRAPVRLRPPFRLGKCFSEAVGSDGLWKSANLHPTRLKGGTRNFPD
jgi:hypothetical protein